MGLKLTEPASGQPMPNSVTNRGLPNPLGGARPIQAVLFDLDGTLYRQPTMRLLMAIELISLPLSAPWRFSKRLKALRTYRQAQERLRDSTEGLNGSLASAQLELAASATGLTKPEVQQLVENWMQRRPLKYLRFCRAKGLDLLLNFLDSRGVRMGVFSDYPAAAKLAALGVGGRFSPVLCASDADINAFKPHPRGFLRACETWGLSPADVLMVGDRPEVDAAGAAAAGMPCVIIGNPSGQRQQFLALPSLERLHRVLDPRA